MSINFEVSYLIPSTLEIIYEAWLNSKKHSDMTGGIAEVSAVEGESFQAWDGYIQGKNLELAPPHRILQHWRTKDFTDLDPDSLLEINFKKEGESTRIIIHHSMLPDHGMQYQQGWIDSYFIPMQKYFGTE